MSDKFVASNGIEVGIDSGELLIGDPALSPLTPSGVIALYEFFQHQRDEELGRWRWPDDPNFVVYKDELDYVPGRNIVRVADESSGKHEWFTVAGFSLPDLHDGFEQAAAAYFAAHLEPKPWHDAKPGEVWVVADENGEHPYTVDETQFYDIHRDCAMDFTDEGISAARRIWPEPTDG